MPGYWLYLLDGAGNFTSSQWIEATGDEEAIMIARAKEMPVPGELWDHERFVAKIPAAE